MPESSLSPTKARVVLLQAVADGAVTMHYPFLPDSPYAEWDRGPAFGPGRRRKVSAQLRDLERAGWVRLEPRPAEAHYKEPRLFVLAETGLTVLEAHDGCP
jgi:hypothetical protein